MDALCSRSGWSKVRRVKPRHGRKRSLFLISFVGLVSRLMEGGRWLLSPRAPWSDVFHHKSAFFMLHPGLIGWPMDPKHSLLCSGGSGGPGGPGGPGVGSRPSFCRADWTLKAASAAALSPRSRGRRRRVSGMLSVGAVLMLLMRSSLASDGKSAAAVGGNRVRGSGAPWNGALTPKKMNVREPTSY